MSNRNIYGYITEYSGFIEISYSEAAAKRAASIDGYTVVGYRSWINNMFIPTAEKVNGKWEVQL